MNCINWAIFKHLYLPGYCIFGPHSKPDVLYSRPSTCLSQFQKPWTKQNPNYETMQLPKLFSFLDATTIQILTNDFHFWKIQLFLMIFHYSQSKFGAHFRTWQVSEDLIRNHCETATSEPRTSCDVLDECMKDHLQSCTTPGGLLCSLGRDICFVDQVVTM